MLKSNTHTTHTQALHHKITVLLLLLTGVLQTMSRDLSIEIQERGINKSHMI